MSLSPGGSGRCPPAEAGLNPLPRIPDLSGEYRLVMVGRSGQARGRRTEGALRLRRRGPGQVIPGPLGSVINLSRDRPFYGSADLNLSEVGALADGSVATEDSIAPGAEVRLDTYARARRTLALSLGSDANRPGVITLDGSGTEMIIREVDRRGFYGTWRAYFSYTDYRAAGFFCALRSGGEPAAAPHAPRR
jgi:hypothetical protein